MYPKSLLILLPIHLIESYMLCHQRNWYHKDIYISNRKKQVLKSGLFQEANTLALHLHFLQILLWILLINFRFNECTLSIIGLSRSLLYRALPHNFISKSPIEVLWHIYRSHTTVYLPLFLSKM